MTDRSEPAQALRTEDSHAEGEPPPAPDVPTEETSAPPIGRVIVFGKFPVAFIRNSVAPKLATRHRIEVARCVDLTRTPKSIDLTPFDAVLALHQFASHAEIEAVHRLAKTSERPFSVLSRKASDWPTELAPILSLLRKRAKRAALGGAPSIRSDAGVPRPDRRSVADERLDEMLQRVKQLRADGLSWSDMVQHVAEYWATGSLTNGNQLYQALYTVEQREACPAWWKPYWDARPKRGRSDSPSIAPVRHIDPSTLHDRNSIPGARPAPAPALFDMGPKAALPPLALVTMGRTAPSADDTTSDRDALIALYEEDNSKLNERVRHLTDLVDSYRRRVENAESRVASPNLPPLGKLPTNVVTVIESFRTLVTYGAVEASEAFDRLARYAQENHDGGKRG